ncbi:MAG TPA: DUF2255 domain-containing protein [Anaerolineae bacterium]|mgnify:FL=1|nr:DUF2255 domain-containing protein [Anaerolineae bacterium]HCK66601.1 DUF2255 domain-containing protein [Anaerolineae bacterium]
MKTKTFPKATLEKIQKERMLGIRVGTNSEHKIIGIWVVTVNGRVFVRSWTRKPRSWWRTFLEDPNGTIYVAGSKRGIKVRAKQVKDNALNDLVTKAYKEKYNKPGDLHYVAEKSPRETTTELVVI